MEVETNASFTYCVGATDVTAHKRLPIRREERLLVGDLPSLLVSEFHFLGEVADVEALIRFGHDHLYQNQRNEPRAIGLRHVEKIFGFVKSVDFLTHLRGVAR